MTDQDLAAPVPRETNPSSRASLQLAVVAFGVFVAADDLMVVASMLRPMMKDLGLALPDDLADTAWIVNVYLIAFIAAIPVAGRLSDRLGRRAVYVGGLGVFAIGSLVIPLADSLGVLLVGRALTAMGGGALVPVSMAVAGDIYAGRKQARALGFLAAIETIGWVWGPLYGALLVRFLSWRWQFYLNLPMAAIGIIAGWRLLSSRPTDRARLRWPAAALLTVALVCGNLAILGQANIQSVTGLEQLQDTEGSWLTSPWFAVPAVLALVGLVLEERRGRDPLFSPCLFRNREAVASMGLGILVGGALVVALVNVPLFINVLEDDLRAAAVTSGWLLSSLTAVMALASVAGGELTTRRGPRAPAMIGVIFALVAFVTMASTWTVTTGQRSMALALAIVGAGIGLVLTPSTVGVVDHAGPDDRGRTAGLVLVARLIGFSLGLAAMTAWGTRRYDALRRTADVPTLGSPNYESELARVGRELAATALGETFFGAALALAVAVVFALALRGRRSWATGAEET